jgi:hypothetical protein
MVILIRLEGSEDPSLEVAYPLRRPPCMLDLGHERRAVLLQQEDQAAELTLNLHKPPTVLTIIVTGSRDWWHQPSVHQPLNGFLQKYDRLLIRNGLAKRGLDDLVHRWTEDHLDQGAVEDPYKADWDRFGNRAGHIRNQRMVDEGADMVLAWANPCRRNGPWCPPGRHPSHGTADCVRRARDAGIPVHFCPRGMSW